MSGIPVEVISRTRHPTIASLVDDVVEGWADWHEAYPDRTVDEYLSEAVSDTVPCTTTVLFQMVVDDNSIAFMDSEATSSTNPFEVLTHAIQAEVEQLACQRIESITPDPSDEEPDPHSRYEMYTREGNAACHLLIEGVREHLSTFRNARDLAAYAYEQMRSLENDYFEVFDTEPRSQIESELRAICQNEGWVVPREGLF